VLAVKVLFFKILNLTGDSLEYIFWLVLAVTAVALVRRLGVINYLEAAFVAIMWFLSNLFFDLLITIQILGVGLLSKWQLWIGYIILMLAIFFFHKKRHVEIRKEQAAHHHGHH
jgi:hypothetical protein